MSKVKKNPTVTIRFNNEEYTMLESLAEGQSKTVGEYIKSLVIKQTKFKEVIEVTIQDIDKAASNLSSGKQFKVRHLFDKNLWETYSIGSRLSVGRKFYKQVENDPYYKSKYQFIKKDSDNAAIYEKK